MSSNDTFFSFTVENLGNTNMKTKKIKITHNPVTKKISVSTLYRNPCKISPCICSAFKKFCFSPTFIVFQPSSRSGTILSQNNFNGNIIFNI